MGRRRLQPDPVYLHRGKRDRICIGLHCFVRQAVSDLHRRRAAFEYWAAGTKAYQNRDHCQTAILNLLDLQLLEDLGVICQPQGVKRTTCSRRVPYSAQLHISIELIMLETDLTSQNLKSVRLQVYRDALVGNKDCICKHTRLPVAIWKP